MGTYYYWAEQSAVYCCLARLGYLKGSWHVALAVAFVAGGPGDGSLLNSPPNARRAGRPTLLTFVELIAQHVYSYCRMRPHLGAETSAVPISGGLHGYFQWRSSRLCCAGHLPTTLGNISQTVRARFHKMATRVCHRTSDLCGTCNGRYRSWGMPPEYFARTNRFGSVHILPYRYPGTIFHRA